MKALENNELKKIEGGGFGWAIALGGALTFLIGVVDGYIRPLACNK